jgi:hypothetical protein
MLVQMDRGRNPTINPFINPDGEKDLYNSRQPADDVANYLGPWSQILENSGYPPEEARICCPCPVASPRATTVPSCAHTSCPARRIGRRVGASPRDHSGVITRLGVLDIVPTRHALLANWGFLTNHAQLLMCIAQDPGGRLRDIAASPPLPPPPGSARMPAITGRIDFPTALQVVACARMAVMSARAVAVICRRRG